MKKTTRRRARSIGAAASLAALVAGAAFVAAPANAEQPPAVLTSGSTLNAGETLVSNSGQYYLDMQSDGNLVEYGNGHPLWTTRTTRNAGARLEMQTDGNAVVYSAAGKALWQSGTSVKTGGTSSLTVGDDGTLTVKRSTGAVAWKVAPGTDFLTAGDSLAPGYYLASGFTRLVMQTDGNLVDYVNGKAVWSSRTNGHPYASAVFQHDGNFVVYSASPQKALWNSRSNGAYYTARLVVGSNGTVTITKGGATYWAIP